MLVLVTLLAFSGSGNAQEISAEILNHPNWKLLDRGDDCGHSFANRIIGGQEARLGQYPWMARLQYGRYVEPESTEDDGYRLEFECGGTIINNRYILTAAHCGSETMSAQFNMNLVSIRVGEHDVTTDIDCEGQVCAPKFQDIEVDQEICHDGYSNKTYQNDICLIRLVTPIEFNDFVIPICLPVYKSLQNQTFEGLVMEVAGWGLTDIATESSSNVLLTVKVPVTNHYLCSLSYSGQTDIVSTQLCAGGQVGKDSCSGDSGGPLMRPFSLKGPPQYFIIGIVSFGPKRCADSETSGVYTLVNKYLNWILDRIHQ